MSQLAGLSLSPDSVRVVTVNRWTHSPVTRLHIEWDPAKAGDAAVLLREKLGALHSLSLAIDPEFLSTTRVSLPPVDVDSKRAMVLLEPDRYFPVVDHALTVQAVERSDLVFASDAARITEWVNAFEAWAPVDCVEAGPVAAARALRALGKKSGVVFLPGRAAGTSVEVKDGVPVAVRREKPTTDDAAAGRGNDSAGVPPEFLAAYGTALAAGGSESSVLAPDSIRERIASRRSQEVLRCVAITVACIFIAFASFWLRDGATLRRQTQEIAELTSRTQRASELQTMLAASELQTATANRTRAGQIDPVAVLAILTRRLPADAYVNMIRLADGEWEIHGTARNAGALIALLDADPHLKDVRFTSATSRFEDGGRIIESFSIGFHATP